MKLTELGVVGPGSTATKVKVTGSPRLVPSAVVPPTIPRPVIVMVLGKVIQSNWTVWICVDWKPLPSPRSLVDTWFGSPSSHLSSSKLKCPLPWFPLKSVPIFLLTYGLEILVTYLVREKLQILVARLEVVVSPLHRCSRCYDQSVTILIFDEHRSVCLSENYCSA